MGVKTKVSVRPNREAKEAEKIRNDARIKNQLDFHSDKEIIEELPLLPTDRLQWELHCRPFIKGEKNRRNRFIT